MTNIDSEEAAAKRHLLRRIERYLTRSRLAPTTFGREATRDPNLVRDLRRGRALTPRIAKKIAAYLERAETQQEGSSCRHRIKIPRRPC